MTDQATLLESPPASPPAAPPAPPAKPAKAATPPAGDPPAGDPPATPPAGDPPAADPAAWRAEMAAEIGGDDAKAVAKALKQLERFKTQGAVGKSWMEAATAMSDSSRVKMPGKDATAEDIAGWNKALGVPEKADGYNMKAILKAAVPEGMTADEGDKEFLKAAFENFHKLGGEAASPRAIEAMTKFYFETKENQTAQALANEQTLRVQTEKELKKEWGPEFKANMDFAKAGLTMLFGKGQIDEVLKTRLADGALLGNYKPFLQAMAQGGRALAQDPLQWAAAGIGGDAKSVDERISEIMALRNGTPAQKKQYDEASKSGGELETLHTKKSAFNKAA